jgi:hypothetical protein
MLIRNKIKSCRKGCFCINYIYFKNKCVGYIHLPYYFLSSTFIYKFIYLQKDERSRLLTKNDSHVQANVVGQVNPKISNQLIML